MFAPALLLGIVFTWCWHHVYCVNRGKMLCSKLMSGNMINAKKSFYDPLKDFMTLNRDMRRSIDGRADGLYEIYADEDYRMIEILAIYQ